MRREVERAEDLTLGRMGEGVSDWEREGVVVEWWKTGMGWKCGEWRMMLECDLEEEGKLLGGASQVAAYVVRGKVL